MQEFKNKIILPDGSTAEHISREGTRLHELAEEYGHYYPAPVILAVMDGKLRELTKKVDRDGEIRFLTVADRDGRRAYRRSLILLLQKAVQKIYGRNALLKVRHSLGEGYYCEIYCEKSGCGSEFCGLDVEAEGKSGRELAESRRRVFLTEQDLNRLHICMDALVEQDLPIRKHHTSTQKAEDIFREMGMPDKERLFYYRRSSRTNIYELDGCYDYFYGFMASGTGLLKYFDLVRYESSFVLLFPGNEWDHVEPLDTSKKLFDTLEESRAWSQKLGVGTVGALNDAISAGRGQQIILLQEAEMEDRIGNLAARIAADKDKKFIMIAGPSSSGKTSFANRLSIQLTSKGMIPHPISLDDYYVNREDNPKHPDGSYDFECLEAIDIELFNRDMTTLLAGGTIDMPTYNFKTGKREYRGNQLTLGASDVLVIEGIHGLNDRLSYSLPAESKFKVYISALTQLNIDEHNPLPTTDGRMLRRMVRDARTRGTSAKSTIAMWPSVRAGEEKNIFPFQESADVMFNSALVYEIAVLKVYAEPLLFQIQKGEPEYFEAQRLLKFLDYFLPLPVEDINHNSLLREFVGGSCFNV